MSVALCSASSLSVSAGSLPGNYPFFGQNSRKLQGTSPRATATTHAAARTGRASIGAYVSWASWVRRPARKSDGTLPWESITDRQCIFWTKTLGCRPNENRPAVNRAACLRGGVADVRGLASLSEHKTISLPRPVRRMPFWEQPTPALANWRNPGLGNSLRRPRRRV